ncbi:MAG: DUF933 domain-containing protein [Acidimicrobiia bacterium]
MKRVGITGPAGSGKTTIWKAIGGSRAAGDIATVEVPDPRLDELVAMHSVSRRAAKRVPVHIELVDVHQPSQTPAAGIARLREMEAVLVVAPAFGGLDGEASLESFLEELVIADLAPVEKRMERARKDPAAKNEIPALESALTMLSSGAFLSERDWDEPLRAALSALAPITLKNLLIVWNVDESGAVGAPPQSSHPVIVLNAAVEAEVSDMGAAEAKVLLEAYGIEGMAKDKVLRAIFTSFDLITFFTLNEKEVRAWELKAGATAPIAAGTIHTDMQRGFIRAEVASFDDVANAGSWDAAKSSGRVRVEGKDYVVADGDVIRIRFSV